MRKSRTMLKNTISTITEKKGLKTNQRGHSFDFERRYFLRKSQKLKREKNWKIIQSFFESLESRIVPEENTKVPFMLAKRFFFLLKNKLWLKIKPLRLESIGEFFGKKVA